MDFSDTAAALRNDRIGQLLGHLPGRLMVFDGYGELVFVNRSGSASPVDRIFAGPRVDDFPRELRDAAGRVGARAQRQGKVADCEVQVTGVWCRLRAIPLEPGSPRGGFALLVDDITEHRRLESELRASSTKAAALLDALPDVVFRIGRGVLLDFRAETQDLLPATPAALVGRALADVFPVALCREIAASIERARSSGEVQRIEHSLDTPSGNRMVELRLVASGPDEAVVVMRDMTEIQFLQERLALADRLAALGTLSAGVAHEINNPLTYILIGIESVLRDLGALSTDQVIGGRLRVYLERLEGALEGARRVRRIVSELRTFARADQEDEQQVDPRAVLDDAAAMVDSQIRYRARLIRDYRPAPMVLGNQDRLVQVFVNLLLNAAQALPEAERDHFIRLRTGEDEIGRVLIEVEDSGHGIATEDLGRVFDPFFTTKPIGEGTGLGLWVCHSIITGHRGTITAESRLGEGTTFRVVLPPAPPVVEAAPGEEDGAGLGALRGRVLVIDDDERVARALAILFEGSELTVLTSGRQALDRLLRDEEFDWIFCDLMMPDLSGMDVYEEIRRTGRGLESRFVFMTGGAFTPRAREFVARVPNACVAKPFHPRQVIAALRQRGTGKAGEP